MINIEQAVFSKFPGFAQQPSIIRNPTLTFLKKMTHENEVNSFLIKNSGLRGLEFVDAVFDYFNFGYSVSSRDRANIPAEGRLVIVANHPIGSLDGLALLRLVSEVRSDVKVLANDLLMQFDALKPLFIPVDNMGSGSALRSYKNTLAALERDEAVIVFPAGEVSRARPMGVKDGTWRPGFLHFARKANAPLLPVHIQAKNSLLFYSASMLFKPLGTALLAHEMFTKRSATIRFRIGEAITPKSLNTDLLNDRTLVKRIRKYVYKVGKNRSKGTPIFTTVRTVAHPENRQQLQRELKSAQLLGETRDHNAIYLFDAFPNSAVMREIGRLREVSFRRVGEGSGSRRDIDEFDQYYRHLVLWDRDRLEIAGAYRIGEGWRILEQFGEQGFYTRSLYRFSSDLKHYLMNGIELGRSFVNPDYWGKASLDYLWQGIGAYLAQNPQVRYLVGPVSMSADYPRELMDLLAFYYLEYHGTQSVLAQANVPYCLSSERETQLRQLFHGLAREEAFEFMLEQFQAHQRKLPILFKQYAGLFEEGGFQALEFSVDPEFGDCLDGLCLADLQKLKASRRRRYIGGAHSPRA